MKKRVTAKPRLTVEREIVRHLTDKELPRVVGGTLEVEVTRTTTSSTCEADTVLL